MNIQEEDSEDKSLIHKLKSKLNSLKANEKTSKNKNVEESRKKRSKVIQLIIVLLLIVLVSDFLMPNEEESVPEVVQVKPKYKKNKPKPADSPQTAGAENTPPESVASETTPAESAGSETTPTETIPSEATNTVTEGGSSENVSKEVPLEAASTTEAPIPEPTVPASNDTVITEDLSVDAPAEKTTQTNVQSPDIIDSSESPASESIITEQILEDLEKQAKKEIKEQEVKKDYVSPPDYEFVGRGLVYNCPGKHWACLDAPSYKICEDNASSVKYLKKKTECYPFNVYQTPKDCQFMQDRMVSSSAKTNFCND